MSPTRREALAQLAALVALPLPLRAWRFTASSPLEGTMVEYQAGRRRGQWSAVQITTDALDRCHAEGMRWRAIDAFALDAMSSAEASDRRLRSGRSLGPLDGVPVFAKAIYDMNALPTTGSSAEWAIAYPEQLKRDALEVKRLRAAGAIVLGKTAADDFAYRGNGTSSRTGQVLNPYDRTKTRTPGGSSAGSAVAVAGGLAFAALGTVHRHRRNEADVRARRAQRRDPDVAVPRHARAARTHRRRRGADARRDRRRRPE
jgi:hypothetical protein